MAVTFRDVAYVLPACISVCRNVRVMVEVETHDDTVTPLMGALSSLIQTNEATPLKF